jgi:hypothetical protein
MESGPSGWRTSSRRLGQTTRGKTADQRLRSLDSFLANEEAALLRRDGPAPLVDLGFGERPTTTIEAMVRLRRVNPKLRMLGIEIDRARLAHAKEMCEEDETFQLALGGFDLRRDHPDWMPARLIRAMNVLRQYDVAAVVPAWQAMGRALDEGGLLVEGTSDPLGRLLVVHRLRRRGEELESEGLAFLTRPQTFTDPRDFQAVLPKSHIHHVVPGEPVHALFEAWAPAWQGTAAIADPIQRFVATGEALHARVPAVSTPRRLLKRGALLWKLALTVPLAACAAPTVPMPASPDPEIRLLYPSENTPLVATEIDDDCTTSFLVVVDVIDFVFRAPNDDEEIPNVEGEGHYHILVDGAYVRWWGTTTWTFPTSRAGRTRSSSPCSRNQGSAAGAGRGGGSSTSAAGFGMLIGARIIVICRPSIRGVISITARDFTASAMRMHCWAPIS